MASSLYDHHGVPLDENRQRALRGRRLHEPRPQSSGRAESPISPDSTVCAEGPVRAESPIRPTPI